MNDSYKAATGWRRLRPSGALRPPACVLCGSPTDRVADCDLPAVPGDDTTEGRPGGVAGFVPVCPSCFEKSGGAQ